MNDNAGSKAQTGPQSHGDLAWVTLRFTYRNWKGEVGQRHVLPHYTWQGVSEYHGDTRQWFLRAYDLEKKATRDFALKDMLSVEAVEPFKAESVRLSKDYKDYVIEGHTP